MHRKPPHPRTVGEPARKPGVLEQVASGAAATALVVIAIRFVLSVALARSQTTVPLEVDLGCCLLLPLGAGACVVLVVQPPLPTIVGTLAAAPIGYAVVDALVDATLSPALPEMAPTANLMIVGCSALTSSCLLVGIFALVVRVAGQHMRAAAAGTALLTTLGSAAVVVCAATTPPSPDLGAWRVFFASVDSRMDSANARALLDEDPTDFVQLAPPAFFERAWATRVPELPYEYGPEIEWPAPTRHALRLGHYGLVGTRDLCFLRTGAHVVLLESSRGVLLLRRTEGETWSACADEGTDWDGLVASEARFEQFGAPSACSWLLAFGGLAGTILLALGARSHRSVASTERMVLAHVEGEDRDTARMERGELVRLATSASKTVHAVLVDPTTVAIDYRGDARSRTANWIAASGGRGPVVEEIQRRAATHFALALVITVWLALPAIAALRHGFVLSFG